MKKLMAHSIISSNHHHHHFLILQTLSSRTFPFFQLPKNSFSSPSSSPRSLTCNVEKLSFGRRRMLSLSTIGFLLSFADQPFSRFLFFSKSLAVELLDKYTDSKEGFTLLVPSSWIKVDKAGATVLFEDPNTKANNVGVVVNPTRISSVDEFGTPQFVANKLIQAERRKESTKEAEVVSFSERSPGDGGLIVYEIEYKLDSTRGGLKRVFSSAFVASKRLYLLNITQSDGLDNPLSLERRMILEKVLHSFDVIPST